MKLAMAILGLVAAGVAACSDPAPRPNAQAAGPGPAPAPASAPPAAPTSLADVHPAPLDIPPIEPSAAPQADPIQQALWAATPKTPQDRRNALIRAEVLLARARFSPGVIDGLDGDNLQRAISAFEAAHDLPQDGRMSQPVWDALAQADPRPVLSDYVIAPDDVKGPFVAKLPTDYRELAKLPALGFAGPAEALAEKFHMDVGLLKSLNPGADFAAGTKVVVAALGPDRLAAPVVRIEVDKSQRQVRAYGADQALLAVYPATVGSAERPAPDGTWAVKGVSRDPTYVFDPSRLTFGKAEYGKLTIKPGPRNPVGSTWIALTVPTYGIHGAPDPRLVGKVASHGCVRLTNWDARQLGEAVKPGVEVDFLGSEAPAKAAL